MLFITCDSQKPRNHLKCSLTDKQIIIYPYNVLLLSIKRYELLIHTINESQNNYAEIKKPDIKEYILKNSIYIKFKKTLTYRDRQQIIGFLTKGRGRIIMKHKDIQEL